MSSQEISLEQLTALFTEAHIIRRTDVFHPIVPDLLKVFDESSKHRIFPEIPKGFGKVLLKL